MKVHCSNSRSQFFLRVWQTEISQSTFIAHTNGANVSQKYIYQKTKQFPLKRSKFHCHMRNVWQKQSTVRKYLKLWRLRETSEAVFHLLPMWVLGGSGHKWAARWAGVGALHGSWGEICFDSTGMWSWMQWRCYTLRFCSCTDVTLTQDPRWCQVWIKSCPLVVRSPETHDDDGSRWKQPVKCLIVAEPEKFK